MAYLGCLRGTGHVLVDDTSIGSADYEIHVFQPKLLKEARGYIIADQSVIQKSAATRVAVLELQDGGTVKFFVREIVSGRAHITITGPIPGF